MVCHDVLSQWFIIMVCLLFDIMVCRIMVSWYHGRISLGESEEPTFCAWQDFLFQRAMLNEKVNPCDHNHCIYFQKWLSFIAISVMSYVCKRTWSDNHKRWNWASRGDWLLRLLLDQERIYHNSLDTTIVLLDDPCCCLNFCFLVIYNWQSRCSTGRCADCCPAGEEWRVTTEEVPKGWKVDHHHSIMTITVIANITQSLESQAGDADRRVHLPTFCSKAGFPFTRHGHGQGWVWKGLHIVFFC